MIKLADELVTDSPQAAEILRISNVYVPGNNMSVIEVEGSSSLKII
jgi:hypothetical protein